MTTEPPPRLASVPGPRYRDTHRWPVTLECRAIGLRPMRMRDAGLWRELRSRNQSWLGPWDPTTPPGGEGPPRTYSEMIWELRRRARQGSMLPWLIDYDPVWVEGERRRPVTAGQLTVSGIALGAARWGQIGYWVDQRWAGHGIVPTAVALATDYCFRVMGLHRIEIAIRPENARSLRVVEKLGFRHEGSRPRYLHIDGDWRDHEVFVITPEEVPEGILARVPQRQRADITDDITEEPDSPFQA
ncbi:GNAT family N-acetyltransferase [Parenemella sanctibonifatiensis]|uniref:GNAT family N-acetyltransferase n=1 Tax=Parenemella sanctibonifatiensis TaxID=2016505 RepID=A0A255EAC4_9ACTN|nr:GNAT family protein [Parenemella sanctibonifatiensis]OYN88456.1 GNAT family N-acetyltransferase [Parenemella sanctibonifatiensis]